MKIIILILIVTLFFVLIYELTNFFTYGKPLDDEELKIFVEKHLNSYEINIKNLWYSYNLPYVSKKYSIFFSWYIQDYGQILRWSKFSKIFNEKNKELEKGINIKKLSDL